ncbi:MAG: TlyA family RNA methyltransferase [Actinomycetota bacterium]
MRRRLDLEMVRRGLAASRSEAGLAIQRGGVTVSGRPAVKSGSLVGTDEPITVSAPGRRFVSRGGEKLDAALDRFDVHIEGRGALDAGASTGGFTDCLLRRGAASVVAVDVGYGQLDWRLRNDARVVVLERTNVRDLTAETLPFVPDVVVCDLSFISLRVAVPALVRVAASDAEFVLLVKPQFEAGREHVHRGGVVTDPTVWTGVLASVWDDLRQEGAVPLGLVASPLLGPAGNVEFFIHAARAVEDALDPGPVIAAAVEEGIGVRSLGTRGAPAP